MRNYWHLSLGLSIILHILILTGIPPLKNNIFSQRNEEIKEIEVVHQKIEKTLPKNTNSFENKPPLPYVENIINKLNTNHSNTVSLSKPPLMEENMKEIVLLEIPQDKNLKKLPAYMNYYRLIRERIRKNAYYYYNSRDRGEVFLSFVILKDGRLESISLNKESVESEVLREIALKSVREAVPFPYFPKELENYARLQFNISIYFKNN
jgi:TonB family protein